jgi:sporulation protein YlmC with PRC-barrel domain
MQGPLAKHESAAARNRGASRRVFSDGATPEDLPVQEPTVSHDNIRASRVRGTEVYNAEGEHLGHIDDIVLGKRDGKAQYAIMSFGGFLGIGEKYHPLPWESLTYDPGRGGYVVSVSREQLEGAPSYAVEEEPDWADPDYGRRLRAYYGYPYI